MQPAPNQAIIQHHKGFVLHGEPAFEDNYLYLLGCEPPEKNTHQHGAAIVVDPGDADAVLRVLAARNWTLTAILLTHHHDDHTQGVAQLRALHPDIPVYGPDSTRMARWVTHPVGEGSVISLFELGLSLSVMAMPGHTAEHIAYYAAPFLFSGDILFGGGCGRIYEGTPAALQASIARILALPADTLICCSHEFTVSNLRFALQVDPHNAALQSRLEAAQRTRATGQPTVPLNIALEQATNPFVRVNTPDILHALHQHLGEPPHDAVAAFFALRQWKNTFRG